MDDNDENWWYDLDDEKRINVLYSFLIIWSIFSLLQSKNSLTLLLNLYSYMASTFKSVDSFIISLPVGTISCMIHFHFVTHYDFLPDSFLWFTFTLSWSQTLCMIHFHFLSSRDFFVFLRLGKVWMKANTGFWLWADHTNETRADTHSWTHLFPNIICIHPYHVYIIYSLVYSWIS